MYLHQTALQIYDSMDCK